MTSRKFTELARIPVQVAPWSTAGALIADKDNDAFKLRSPVPGDTSAPIGVNVDSLLLLDALDDGTVFEVEVVGDRSMWRTASSMPEVPPSAGAGSIVISDAGPEIYVDALSPRFTSDNHGQLLIQLEPLDNQTRWVALSAECFALVNDGFLAGFRAQCHLA